MQFVGDICSVYILTVLTNVLKYQIFLRIFYFSLVKLLIMGNILSIPHIPMNVDDFITHFQFFFRITLGSSEAMHAKVRKLSLTSYVHFLHHARAIHILFDCELHKLIF